MPWTKGKIEKAWRIFDKSMHVIADALEVDVLELKALILEGSLPPYDREDPLKAYMPAPHVPTAFDRVEAVFKAHPDWSTEDIAAAAETGRSTTSVYISRLKKGLDAGGSKRKDPPAVADPVWIDETPPAPTREIVEHMTKRATLADLAAPAPEVVLEQAQPIISEPIQFTTTPPFSTMSQETQASITSLVEVAAEQISAKPAEMLIGESLEDRPLPARRSNLGNAAEDKRRPHKPAEFYLMHKGKYLHESCEGLTDKPEHAWRQPEGKIAAVRRKFPETLDYIEVLAS